MTTAYESLAELATRSGGSQVIDVTSSADAELQFALSDDVQIRFVDPGSVYLRGLIDLPAPGNARDRAVRQIAALQADGYITDTAAYRAAGIAGLFDADTVYASVAPDDEHGVVFFWRAGDWTVEIDVVEPSGFYWHIVRDGEEALQGEGTTLPIAEVTGALTEFSRRVASVNPMWRENFR